jgi:hypothetical protein
VSEASPTAIGGDVQRREFIKKAAMVGWTVPVILTLGADRAGAIHRLGHGRASCIKSGRECLPNGVPCCSGYPCQQTGRSSRYRCTP